jgi:hypothetical protein
MNEVSRAVEYDASYRSSGDARRLIHLMSGS